MDRQGYLAELAETIAKMGLNVTGVNAKHNSDQTSTMLVTVEVSNVDQVTELMSKLRQMRDTIDVYRVKN